MRLTSLLLSTVLLVACTFAPALARTNHSNSTHRSSTHKPKKPKATNADSNSSRPSGATARCADGTVSYSAHRQGTCSHHGGVAEWY
jgi:hypothetical protein